MKINDVFDQITYTHPNLDSNFGGKITSFKALFFLVLSSFIVKIGCLAASNKENLDVSRTNEGLPKMYKNNINIYRWIIYVKNLHILKIIN